MGRRLALIAACLLLAFTPHQESGLALPASLEPDAPAGPGPASPPSLLEPDPAPEGPVRLDDSATPPAPAPLIAIDPGHGGRESGAVHRGADGTIDLVEKEVNLRIALRLEELLLAEGYGVVLTRRTDTEVNLPRLDRNGDGRIDPDDDLQARVDIANQAGAALLFSIHNNGVANPSVRGTSTWYCADHPWGDASRELAALLQGALVGRLREAGYSEVVDMGFHDDPPLRKPYGHLFLVGPRTPRVARESQMPGVVGESLFVTNDREAALLKDPTIIDAIARAYADAAAAFLASRS